MTALNTTVNDRAITREEIEPATLLIEWLRDGLGLTGTHMGCDTSQCGACTVLVDGQSMKSCTMLALQAQGRHITTIEGVATGEKLHPVQDAFIACHGLQCGFCTPGMVMSTLCLLREHALPSTEQIITALEGNLCRCTGYVNIVKSVQVAAQTAAQTPAGGAR